MANTREYQFLYSKQPMLTMRNGLVTFGGSGSVGTAAGPGLYAVTKLGTGVYQIKLKDSFNAFVGGQFTMTSGTSGAAVGDGTFSTNSLYQIVTVGTTNWAAIGLDSDYTAAIGQVFVASGTGGTGSGTARIIASAGSGIATVEIVQNQTTQLTNLYPNLGRGAAIVVRTLANTSGTTDGTTTTNVLVATSPAAGSQMSYKLWFRNSTAQAV